MPEPTYRTDPGFPAAVERKLRELARFEEAGAFGRRSPSLGDVHDALLTLTAEIRHLRYALEPSSSPLITGDAAVREFKRIQEANDA